MPQDIHLHRHFRFELLSVTRPKPRAPVANALCNADLKNAPFTSVFSPNCQSSLAIQIEASKSINPTSQNPGCATVAGAPTALDQDLPVPSAPNISNLANIPALSFVAEAPKFRSALIQQFNMQVEQQFGANVFTIGYVGNIGQHLPESINNINQPAPFNPITNPGGSARPLSTQLPNLAELHPTAVSVCSQSAVLTLGKHPARGRREPSSHGLSCVPHSEQFRERHLWHLRLCCCSMTGKV